MRSGPSGSKQLWVTMRVLASALVVSACGSDDPARSASDTTETSTAVSIASPLDSAARQVVAFLRGEAPYSSVVLADTISLYLGKEGGGTRRMLTREQLRRPSSWRVQSRAGTFSFVPPRAHTKLTMKPGAHFQCTERQLAASFPQLASLPHVGVLLEPEKRDSCLQTWNATFVFDNSERPRLVAAVYDQWEW
jgi:hypothetical protein